VKIRPYATAAAVTSLLASVARAQGSLDSQCASSAYVPGTIPNVQQIKADACQKAIDLFNFMAPQLGTSITGGNATLGSASPLGGLGHFSLGLRGNVVRGQIPRTGNISLGVTGAQRSNFDPKSQIVGLPTAEAAIGLFKGVPVGLTNVGGVDALVSVFYVPDVDEDDVTVHTSGGAVKLGYGLRVGILQETSIVPGVSVSFLRRDLPTIDVAARVGTGDSVRVSGLDANTTMWRLAASKRILLLGLTAGAGQDKYDSKAVGQAFVASRPIAAGIVSPAFSATVASVSQRLTRTNVFVGASLNFPIFRIGAELGRASGGSIVTPYNTFGDRSPDDAYTYASFGFRLGF
jgi:hypothetical protein